MVSKIKRGRTPGRSDIEGGRKPSNKWNGVEQNKDVIVLNGLESNSTVKCEDGTVK